MLTFCESLLPWMLETIERLVRAESPSSDKDAVDRCGRALAGELAALGAELQILPRSHAGDHVRAAFGSGPRQVMVLGHFDTVWPVGQLARAPIRRDGDRLFGPGVYDMKAGIVLAMAAVRTLRATRTLERARVVMLWTSDEEVGSATSREALEEEARASDAVLVLEPPLPGGRLKTARHGCAGFEVTVQGVAAHAGIEPEKGASAVEELAHQILRINSFNRPEDGLLVNVVQAWGGARANVIPDDAHALVDIRVPTRTAWEDVSRQFQALSPVDGRTTIHARGWFDRPPLERTEGVAKLYSSARDVAARLGRDLEEGATSGGSDGNFTAAIGVPTLDGLGAIGDGAHALHEHVVVSELPFRAALLAGLIDDLSKGW